VSATHSAAHLVHTPAGTPFSLTDPTWITAVATAVLAAFAIVTAWYARRAFCEQAEEVRTLKIQLSDQQGLTAKQTPVLDLELGEDREHAEEHLAHQCGRAGRWPWTFPVPPTGCRSLGAVSQLNKAIDDAED
jgi:hypothetical protein